MYQYSPKAKEKPAAGLGFDEVFVKPQASSVLSNSSVGQQIPAPGRKTHPSDKFDDKLENHLKIRDSTLKGNKGQSTPRTPFHQSIQDQFTSSKTGRQSSPALGAIATKVGTTIGSNGKQSDNSTLNSNGQIKNLNQAGIISSIEKNEKDGGKDGAALKNIDALQPDAANSTQSVANICEDSFQRLYSKELDIDEDEVPLILHELNDSAIHFISKEQYDRALSLLQKAQTLLDRLMFQRNAMDRFLIQCTMHNMALCFQKMGALEECSLCLDACLTQISSPYVERLYKSDPPRKLKRLKYECKIHMQVCALLSQLNRHQEALCHAKRSVQISQYMINDLMELCETLNQKITQAKKREQVAQDILQKGELNPQLSQFLNMEGENYIKEYTENKLNKSDLIYFDEQVSMLERTALKFYPIIQEVAKRMTKHKENAPITPLQISKSNSQKNKPFDNDLKSHRENREQQKREEEEKQVNPYQSDWVIQKQKDLKAKPNDKASANAINMRVLLGYLNQSEWMYLLNIGNIMQITPMTIHDLHSTASIEVELARDSIIEKISFLAVSYFCVSTELRFLVNMRDNPNVDPVQVKAESEYWHGKALEISCTFLPSESPLVSHIHQSYKKHHAPVGQVIPEEDEAAAADAGKKKNQKRELDLKVIRPLQGIDQCKYQPMVRANHNMNIALSPLNMSPNHYIKIQFEKLNMNKNGTESRAQPSRNDSRKDQRKEDKQMMTSTGVNTTSPAPIKIHDEQPSRTQIDKENTQRIQQSRKGMDLGSDGKTIDPLNTVTTLNFKNLRDEDAEQSPRHSSQQPHEQSKPDNKHQQKVAQTSQATSKVTLNSSLQRNQHQNENRYAQNQERPRNENDFMKLDQIGDLSDIIREERTDNDTVDNNRIQDSADNINNTTEMIMELADKNFESLNSHASKNHLNPPPSVQQNSSSLRGMTNEDQDPRQAAGKPSQFSKQARSPTNIELMASKEPKGGQFNTVEHESSQNLGVRQRPDRPDDRRQVKQESQLDRSGKTSQNQYLKDTKIDNEMLARDNDGKYSSLQNEGKSSARRDRANVNPVETQSNQLILTNAQQKSRPRTSENQRQNLQQNKDKHNQRDQHGGITAQTSTHISESKNQQKSFQTLNVGPSTQSNIETNTEKVMQNIAKHANQTTLSTSLNAPTGSTHHSNIGGEQRDLTQHRSSTQQNYYHQQQQQLLAQKSNSYSPQRNDRSIASEETINKSGGTISQQQILQKKNNLKSDLISPPVEQNAKYQQQLREAVLELQAKRHDLHSNEKGSSGVKDNVNSAGKYSTLGSAKNQGSLQKKLQNQLQDLNSKQKAAGQQQQVPKPLSGNRLSKSGKKSKYSSRGPLPDQGKSRDLILQNQAQQQQAHQKIYSSHGSLVASHAAQDQIQKQSQGQQQKHGGKSVGRPDNHAQKPAAAGQMHTGSRYKQNQNQSQQQPSAHASSHKYQTNGQNASSSSGPSLFIQTDQAQQQDILNLEGLVAYRQIQTAIGSTRNSKTPHDTGLGSSNFQTTPVSSQNMMLEQRLKIHQTIDQTAGGNGSTMQTQLSSQSRNMMKINNSVVSKSQGATRQNSTKRYKIQGSANQDGGSSVERQSQQDLSKRKGQNAIELGSDHGHHNINNFSTQQANQDGSHGMQNLSMNSGGRMNMSALNNNKHDVSYQTSGNVNRTNLEIIQTKHQQLYTRSSNSREKDKKKAPQGSSSSQQQNLKVIKSGVQLSGFNQAKVHGQLISNIIKNQNFVQSQNQQREQQVPSQAPGTGSATQQNRNFEIQTQMLGQQMKIKAPARTSVQTPTGPMSIPPSSQQPKASKMQQLQAQTANRSASGGSSGARSGVAVSSGSRSRPNPTQINGTMIQMNIHPVSQQQQQQIKVALSQKSQRNSAKKYQDNGKQMLMHSSRNERGLVAQQDGQAQHFQTEGVTRTNRGGNSERGSNNQQMLIKPHRPGSATAQNQHMNSSRGHAHGTGTTDEQRILAMHKQKHQSRNQYNQNFKAVGPPHSNGGSKTLPEQQPLHNGGHDQMYVKPHKSSRNAPNQMAQQNLSAQNISANISAIGLNQSASLMNEDITNVRDLQMQIQSKLTDMQRGGPGPHTSNAQHQQRSNSKQTSHDGHHVVMQQVQKGSKSAGKIATATQLEKQMNMLHQQQREHIKAQNQQAQAEQQQQITKTQTRPQSSNRNKLQLNMKMVVGMGATERNSHSGNERVAENERVGRQNGVNSGGGHGNLMLLHGSGGMIGGHHMKSAGGLNTVKNNDHKIKFSGNPPSDSQRGGIQFNQQNIKFDMKNSSQNVHNLQNFNNFNGNSLETSMNNRFPGTAINTSTAFPSTPNLRSARGSVQNAGQEQGHTVNSSNSSIHTFNNLVNHQHKQQNLHGAMPSSSNPQSYRQMATSQTHQSSIQQPHHNQSNASSASAHSNQMQQPANQHQPTQGQGQNLKTNMKISVNQNGRKQKQQQAQVLTQQVEMVDRSDGPGVVMRQGQDERHHPGVGGRPQRNINVRKE